MRVVFLGTPEFAVPSLRALLESRRDVVAVFTQPDRPAGRGQKLQPPPVKVFAAAAGITVWQPEKIRSPEHRSLLESYQPDVIVVAAYGQLLPAWLLQLPPMGCVNVHGSLLPRYRGAAPVAWAILNGDATTGITTMLMDEHLDTGPMLLKKEIEIGMTTTAGELAARLAEVGAQLLIPTLDGLASGVLTPVPQDNASACLAPRISKEMGRVQWNRSALGIHNQIRGLNPWPLAYSDSRGQRVQILCSVPPAPVAGPHLDVGTFLGATDRGMKVVCGEGSVLELTEVQPAGKRRVSGREFANGARLKPGDRPFA